MENIIFPAILRIWIASTFRKKFPSNDQFSWWISRKLSKPSSPNNLQKKSQETTSFQAISSSAKIIKQQRYHYGRVEDHFTDQIKRHALRKESCGSVAVVNFRCWFPKASKFDGGLLVEHVSTKSLQFLQKHSHPFRFGHSVLWTSLWKKYERFWN